MRFFHRHITAIPASAAFLTALLSGCGNTSPAGISSQPVPALHGSMFGGQQPVIGATIKLYAVGMPTTGGAYGAGQTSLLTSTVTTDGNGNFNITGLYPCPTNSYVYITGSGGQPSSNGQQNSALALMAALGPCWNLRSSTTININEATTVAGIWSLQQFATATFGTVGTLSIGAPSTNIVGLQNAFGASGNLAVTSTGVIPASTAISKTVNGSTVNVTILNEQAKMGTLANILAACINSTDSGGSISSICSSFFNSVKPSGQTLAPADTLQAALDMARNPTNVGSATAPPFSLATAVSPFQPSLSTPPADYTLGLAYGSTSILGTSGAQSYFFYTPNSIAIDSNGDVYSVNGPGSATTSPYNNVSVLDPTGTPVNTFYAGSQLNQPRGMALDTSNNVWITNQAATVPANTLFEFLQSGTTQSFTSSNGLYGIAIDGNNNVFTGSNSAQQVYELAAGATTIHGLGAATGPEAIAIDASNNVWTVGFSVSNAYKFAATCTTTCTFSAPVSYTGLTSPLGIAIDSNNTPWVNQPTANTMVMLNPAVPSNGGTATAAKLGGLNSPQFLAIDGMGNLWAANSSPASVTEIQAGSTTVALSPSVGFAHTYNAPRGIAIDMSGNVWVTNSGSTNAAGSYGLTELVGAASPAVQPLSLAAHLGKIGKLP